MSKFGLLGDVDTQLSQVRRDVGHANANVNNVRRALEQGPLDVEVQARLVDLLKEAEAKLDGLLQR